MMATAFTDAVAPFSDSDDGSYSNYSDDGAAGDGEDGPPTTLQQRSAATVPGGAAALRYRRFVDSEMRRLTEERIMYLRRIELARRKTRAVAEETAELKASIKSQQLSLSKSSKVGAAKAAEANRRAIKRKGDRLDRQAAFLMAKYNKALAANQEVRDRIDEIRRERVIFNDLFKRMEAELAQQDRRIRRCNAEAEACYKERDGAQQDMQELKEELDSRVASMKEEWAELTQQIEEGDQVIEATQNAAKHGIQELQRGELSLDEEMALKRNVKRGQWAIGTQKAQLRDSKAKLGEYERDWATIVEATGVDKFDELVYAFKSFDDTKYSKVANATSLVSEIEALEIGLKQLQDEWDARRATAEARLGYRHRKLAGKRLGVSTAQEALRDTKNRIQGVEKTLQSLLQPMQKLFQKIGCDKMLNARNEDVPAMFRNPTIRSTVRNGASIHNARQFMGVIEARAAEILQRHTLMKARQPGSPDLKHMLAGTLGPTVPSGGLKQHIQASVFRLASIDDVDLGSDDGMAGFEPDQPRPLTSDELRRSARLVLNRASSLAVDSASSAAAQALSSTLPSVHKHGGRR